jgi:diadenosine tetraphosphate (Ap4A) HIT family hydrolase
MTENCAFCGIARGTEPASIVWEDGLTLAVIDLRQFQEVPHLHFHVHPRMLGDRLLQVYPSAPALPDRAALDEYAATLRSFLIPATAEAR